MGSTWSFCSFLCVRKRQELRLCVYFCLNWSCMAGKQLSFCLDLGAVIPWHWARASPAKITWLGHQRHGPQHIVGQGPAQSRDDGVMRTLCLQTSWHNSWLLCHLCPCWFLLLCFPFGWVVVETEVDLARWSGDIISDQTLAGGRLS